MIFKTVFAVSQHDNQHIKQAMINPHTSSRKILIDEQPPSKTGGQKKCTIHIRSYTLLKQLLSENPKLAQILRRSGTEPEVLNQLRNWMEDILQEDSAAFMYYRGKTSGQSVLKEIQPQSIAAIRILEYLDHHNLTLADPNLQGKQITSNPLGLLWLAVKESAAVAEPDFFEDMVYLFRQLCRKTEQFICDPQKLKNWMGNYSSGLDASVIQQREENRTRILNHIIDLIESGKKQDPIYRFVRGLTRNEKLKIAEEWWKDRRFHLRFAVRNPKDLNKMLDNSLDENTMGVLRKAEETGIPFFVTPYYLSLLQVRENLNHAFDDYAIRDYIIYSRQLVDEFGKISAWEKEDIAEPGQPNAAGWITPGNNIHRRYPEVAILIPDTLGRACGGLCSTCQRMYGFQKGHLNFNLEKLAPNKSWKSKLTQLMAYFENDSQLRDVLITGGDALMSSNKSLKSILSSVYEMAKSKRQKNLHRALTEKHAEITRVRLGTRLPVYLPQRITPELLEILRAFKVKASKIGIKQFVIQTHFVSPLEVTPEAKKAIQGLISAGWIVTNQLVFTTASSRRGHAAKLREVLNQIGVLPYYTFSVKGFMENNHHFATNARLVQEQYEEKAIGNLSQKARTSISQFARQPENIIDQISQLQQSQNLPFLSSDRSVLNMPGVGKSLSFRVIGITKTGRRILKFKHDTTRWHTPLINEMSHVTIVESKSISAYLRQLQEMGEDLADYQGLYGYSIGETEDRIPMFNYPDSNKPITDTLTNFAVPE